MQPFYRGVGLQLFTVGLQPFYSGSTTVLHVPTDAVWASKGGRAPRKCRVTSPIGKRTPLGPYSRAMTRVLGEWAFSYGRGTPVMGGVRLGAGQRVTILCAQQALMGTTPYPLQGCLTHKNQRTPRTLQ